MLKKVILFFILSSTLFCVGQLNHLKVEFRNLSWIMDKKACEVVSTLSHHYGNKALLNNDTIFVDANRYNLYLDSLTLWKMTKDAFKEHNTKAKSTTAGGFIPAATRHSNKEWLKIYDKETRDAYAANKNSTIGNNSCIPSSYDNLKFFYAKESEYIKSYNNGRIKLYAYQSNSDYDWNEYNIHIHDTIKYYLAFHKTIQPIDNNGVCYDGIWLPFVYIYPQPKQAVYPATINKVWEAKTGLPYSVAQELELTNDRIVKILSMPKVINEDVLIHELKINKEFYIAVNCDTCDVKLFDNHKEDNDVVNFTYQNKTDQITIKNAGTDYQVILQQDNSFYLFAVSEGSLETCTVDALINGQSHIFTMKKGERILIKLKKI